MLINAVSHDDAGLPRHDDGARLTTSSRQSIASPPNTWKAAARPSPTHRSETFLDAHPEIQFFEILFYEHGGRSRAANGLPAVVRSGGVQAGALPAGFDPCERHHRPGRRSDGLGFGRMVTQIAWRGPSLVGSRQAVVGADVAQVPMAMYELDGKPQ